MPARHHGVDQPEVRGSHRPGHSNSPRSARHFLDQVIVARAVVLVHANAHVVEQPHDGVDGARPRELTQQHPVVPYLGLLHVDYGVHLFKASSTRRLVWHRRGSVSVERMSRCSTPHPGAPSLP
jgi:hypothetical protein